MPIDWESAAHAEKEIRNAVANEMRHFGNVVARFSFFVKIKMLAAKSKIA